MLSVQKPCIIQHFVQHLAHYYFKLLTTLIISLNLVLLWQAHHKRHLPKWCLENDTYCLVLLLTGICILLMLYKKSSFYTPFQYHNEMNPNQWIWVLLWSPLQGWTTPNIRVSIHPCIYLQISENSPMHSARTPGSSFFSSIESIHTPLCLHQPFSQGLLVQIEEHFTCNSIYYRE